MAILALGGLLAWAFIVSHLTDGDALPLAALSAGAAFVAIGAYRLGGRGGSRTALVAAAAAAALLHLPGLGGTYPSGIPFGPLDYANASGAFAVVGAAACLLSAARLLAWPPRVPLVMAAAGFAATGVRSGSRAATVGLGLVVIGALVGRPGAVRGWLVACGGLVAVAVVTTGWLAAHYVDERVPGSLPSAVVAVVTQQRLDLWGDALLITVEHPLTGVGPGRFRDLAPTASGDPDAVAAHNSYLQAAAELGVPGLALALVVTGCALGALAQGRADRGAAVAGGALVAIALHATVDYVLHAPAVTLLLSAVIGSGAVPHVPRTKERPARATVPDHLAARSTITTGRRGDRGE